MPYDDPCRQGLHHPARPENPGEGPGDLHLAVSDGVENRSSELGGTIPRNTGPGTAIGHQGTPAPVRRVRDLVRPQLGNAANQDPKFPGIVDTVMLALRYSQPNPAEITDPSTNLTSTIYNVGEYIRYRTGVEATADERWLRYDALLAGHRAGN